MNFDDKNECKSYADRFEPDAKRIYYACGHEETHGGNAADPACVAAENAGALKMERSDDVCSECKLGICDDSFNLHSKTTQCVNWRFREKAEL
jgi:hypothetical protein